MIGRLSHHMLTTFLSFQEDTLVHFLCDASHFGSHVAYEEEANGGRGHYHLGYPEGHVPAVMFGNSAEGKPRHERPHCNRTKCV